MAGRHGFFLIRLQKNSIKYSFKKVISRYCSSLATEAKTKDTHQVYCFGLNEHGGLGLKKEPNSQVRLFYSKPIKHFFADDHPVWLAEAGYGFSVFSLITNDTFKVYGCGINTDFQIGAHYSPQGAPLEVLLRPVPVNLGIKCPQTQVIAMSAGRAHLAVLTDKEGVYLSGSNCYGQCGRSIAEDDRLSGVFNVNNIERLGNEEIVDVCCGQDHTLFLTRSGRVWSCGWSCDGQTGLGHTEVAPSPCALTGDIGNERIVKITSRSDCNLALNCRGEVFGWGNNEYGQLCEAADTQQINSPMKLDFVNQLGKITDIATGGSFCLVVNEAGDVFVWGYGILGGGPELNKTSKPFCLPRTLFGWSDYQPETKVVKVYCGLSHLAAINNYGHLYTWGRNKHGCLGIGHSRDQYFPYKVAFYGLAINVSCGVDHTLVLSKPFSQ